MLKKLLLIYIIAFSTNCYSETINKPYVVYNDNIYTLDISCVTKTIQTEYQFKISPGEIPKYDFTLSHYYKVEKIVDGDTIKILMDDKLKTVRLIGVDTPETVHPRKGVQPYGKEASNFTKNLLVGEYVYFVNDSLNNKPDKYGRLLGYVFRYPDGLFVNLELIRQGYAKAYLTYPFNYKLLFKYYEDVAIKNEKGLWKK